MTGEGDTPRATPSPAPLGHARPAEGDEPQTIAGRYRVIRKLGEGGMGAVFLAEHVHMRKRFAVKVLLPEALRDPELVARFEREAVAAGSIAHPGVCAATDFGRLPDGSFFLVLEYVDGESLKHVLEGGALPVARALEITKQVLAALGAAHAKGIIHRDVKPANVMIVRRAEGDLVKVLDFGIAKVAQSSEEAGPNSNLTRMGAIYGTPSYLSPEQAMAKAIDHRADLYAVGVMLFEMIRGKLPFEEDGFMLIAQHVNAPPPPLSSPIDATSLTDDVRALVTRLLAKQPDERPRDAAEAIAAIDALGSSSHATIAGTHATVAAASGTLGVGAAPSGETPVARVLRLVKACSGATSRARDRFLALREAVLPRLEPFASRIRVSPKQLFAMLSVTAAVLVAIAMIVALRPKTSRDDAPEAASRAAPIATAPPKSKANANANAKAAAPVAKKSGDGVHGLGPKIGNTF